MALEMKCYPYKETVMNTYRKDDTVVNFYIYRISLMSLNSPSRKANFFLQRVATF